jgi:hypothetical protein
MFSLMGAHLVDVMAVNFFASQLNLQENMNARYCKYELHVVAAAINSGERALIFMRLQAQ